MTKEVIMYDTYFVYEAARRMAEERLNAATREQTLIRLRSGLPVKSRLHQAVTLGWRGGLNPTEVERELGLTTDERLLN